MLYSRPQLKLLLILAATLSAGLGVREWRAGFPDMAERLERFDREEPVAPPASLSPQERRPAAPSKVAAPAIGALIASPEAGRVDAAAGAQSPVRAGPPAMAPADPRPLDINRAGLGELARLPGVGFGMAARILAERERRGRFDSPEALRSVLGMGPKKLASIRELVTVSE